MISTPRPWRSKNGPSLKTCECITSFLKNTETNLSKMKYKNVIKARFLSRPNRFIAFCEVDGEKETVHVKNTGRCRELLVPDATVYLEVSDNPERKTKFDLIAVEKVTERGILMINMD